MTMPPWGEEPQEQAPPPPPPPSSPYGQGSAPYGQPASPYQPYGAPSPYSGYPTPPQTNGLAIASLIVSIASIPVCCGLAGIVGAILGHVARKQIRTQPNQTGEGMALGGIIVGWIAFGLSLVGIAFYVVAIIIGISASDDADNCHTDSDGYYVCIN
ncbi:DUF4190 domain-containing protein [Nocardioides sp. MH1]|uniref:DUF4190 domain-containing protein n=1 Tax=Nocardioides sp. MH1 TaxID=3242490 RepID=UPI00352086B2